MLFLTLLIIIVPIAWYYFRHSLSYWTRHNVIQTKPWPIFGDSFWTFVSRESQYAFGERIYKLTNTARYVGFYQMQSPVLMIKDPELLKQVLVKDFDHFTDHFQFVDPTADPIWANNLFALPGQKWRDMRITLSPAFTGVKMRIMFTLIEEVVDNYMKHYRNLKEKCTSVEMKHLASSFTNDVIATTAFGLQVDSLKDPNNEFQQMGKALSAPPDALTMCKFFLFMLCPQVSNFLEIAFLPKKVRDFFQQIVHETIEARKSKNINRPDMIQILMETEHKDRKLSELEIAAQAMIFFFAGFDTVSGILSFALYELGANPDIQERLRQEILEEDKLTYEGVLKLKYLDQVISETLRKWPSFVLNDRECTKPYTIEPQKPGELPIHFKVKDLIVIPTYSFQHDEQFFPNPSKFDPERFSEDNKHNIETYAYLPFGGGPRACIGSRLALLEIKCFLFKLLKEFKVVPNSKTEIPPVLNPKDLNLSALNGLWFDLEKL